MLAPIPQILGSGAVAVTEDRRSSFRRNHGCNLFLTILTLLASMASGACLLWLPLSTAQYIPISVGVMYLIYWIECLASHTRQFVGNILDTESVHDFVYRVRCSPPALVSHCQCYHYETRTRIVSYRNSDGSYSTYVQG
jgi:hypothetical protein